MMINVPDDMVNKYCETLRAEKELRKQGTALREQYGNENKAGNKEKASAVYDKFLQNEVLLHKANTDTGRNMRDISNTAFEQIHKQHAIK